MLLKSPGMKGMYYYPPVLSDWCQMRAYENFQINLLENLITFKLDLKALLV